MALLTVADLLMVVGLAGGPDELGERTAVDQFHHHFEVAGFILAHRVDGHDRRMVEPGVQAAFVEEGADRARIVPEFFIQFLDRDDAVENQVAGFADLSDSARREVAQKTILTDAAGELRNRLRFSRCRLC